MQENNNFEAIISTWRRLSGEQIETAVVSMSGDSTENPHKKKEEEVDLLVPERSKAPIVSVATASTALATGEAPNDSGTSNSDENKRFIQYDKEESKEAAGDTNERSSRNDRNDDYLENDKDGKKSEKEGKPKMTDNVDSVYLRPPPPHKVRSNTSTAEEEDCGIKCLYYTLQCCDCVLM